MNVIVQLKGSDTAICEELGLTAKARAPICKISRDISAIQPTATITVMRGETICFEETPAALWAGLDVMETAVPHFIEARNTELKAS